MSANIDMTNNRANMAFMGSREDIWHRMGQEMAPGMSLEDWSKAAGLGVAESVARFNAAQFGSGDTFKGKAMELLLPLVKDKVLIDA